MRVQVSVWQPPDESDSPTYRDDGGTMGNLQQVGYGTMRP